MENLASEDLAVARASLVVARDGDECIVGRPDLGIYVAVPEPGAVLVEALRSGASLAEATASASEAAGESVDGEDFLITLGEAGLLAGIDPARSRGPALPGRARPVRWIEGVSPRVAGRFFGRIAWAVYAGAAVFAIGTLILRVDLRPTPEAVWFLADPALSILGVAALVFPVAAVHEMWHWLAARALGVPAVFRVSYRGFYLVFETDVTQIVTTPRRRRYSVFLAGMAVEGCMLALALALRMLYRAGVLALPGIVDRLLGVTTLFICLSIGWQWGAMFLRSDGYAVLANALRCQNLNRVTWLTVKGRLVGLNAHESTELDDAQIRDRRVAAWFGAVYVVGMAAIAWLFINLSLPAVLTMLVWLANNLAGAHVRSAAFWESAAAAIYVIALYIAPVVLALRERRMRRAGVML